MKEIVRYENRRLYDKETSKAVNLQDIQKYVNSGIEISIIDKNSGENVTSKILGQIFIRICDKKENDPLMSKFLLTALIQGSGDGLLGMVRKFVFAGIGVTPLNSKEKFVLFDKVFGQTLDRIHETIDVLSQEGEFQTKNFVKSIKKQVEKNIQDVQKYFITSGDKLPKK